MIGFARKALVQQHNQIAKLFILSIIFTLTACSGSGSSSNFSVSNVVGSSSARTGNPNSITFTLKSKQAVNNAELSYTIVSLEDPTQTYTVGGESRNLNRDGTTISKTFLIPNTLEDGKYRLNVTIDEINGRQGILLQSKTLTIKEVDIFTPSTAEIAIVSAKLNNNSFTLKKRPNDQNGIITGRGDLLIDLILESKYKSTSEDIDLEFDLDLGGLGIFPLDVTSRINIRNAGGTDNHRAVTADGKVLERIKGRVRTVSEGCVSVDGLERCATIGKNYNRHVHVDLHINEATFNALNLNAQNVTGKVIVKMSSSALVSDVELELPLVYLHQNKDAPLSRASVFSISSASDNNEVDEVQTTASGDSEYIYHETTSSANTFTDSDGQAYSEQSQDVNVSMGYQDENTEGQTFSLASMSTSVSSDESEDVNNTEFSMGLDSSGGTIWDFSEVSGDTSSTSQAVFNKSIQQSFYSYSSDSTESTSYNPQNEMAWTHCSDHKDICDITNFVTGSTQVRYGSISEDKWNYKFVTDTVKCNDDNFGDPANGKEKTCQYLPLPSYAPKWERCAAEGGSCDLGSDTKAIRYGSNSAWTQLYTTGIINCDDDTFGDPRKGKDKWCEIMTSAGTTPLDYEWVACGDASDGDTCEVGSSAVVRIGTKPNKAGDFYSFLNVRSSIQCKDKHFGDPIDGNKDKKCDFLRYIDPAARQDETNLTWSTKNNDISLNTSSDSVTELAGEEQALVEVEFSEGMSFRFYGLVLEAEVKISGAVGLKSSAFVDTKNKTFTLTGGPFVDVDSKATGKVYDALHITEVGIKAPLAVLDIYSPFTIAFTVKPGTLTAELSLDYFLDLLAGDVILYYEYSLWPYEDSDDEVIYQWNYLYQITDNIYKGSQSWKFEPIQDYILPAIPDGFFEQKIGFPTPIEGRDYYLELSGSLVNNDVWDPENPNESVIIDILCGDNIIESMVFSGEIRERIPLGECSEVIISGIRATSWADENGMSFGIRE